MEILESILFLFTTTLFAIIGLSGALKRRLFIGSMWPGQSLDKKGVQAVIWGGVMFLVFGIVGPWVVFTGPLNNGYTPVFIVVIFLAIMFAFFWDSKVNKRGKIKWI